jgi:membrane protein
MKPIFASVNHFFNTYIWESDPPDRLRKWFYLFLQIIILSVKELFRKNALVRTSALAYSAILALIPLLALLFAIFKGFGIQRLLAAHLLPQLAGGSQEFARQILDYIESTNVASLGVFGVVWLLVALLILMTNVEKAFNETWGVTQSRPWWRKLSDYLSIFLLFPIIMAVAISITSVFSSHPQIRQLFQSFLPEAFYSVYTRFVSFELVWLAFIFIYMVIPNTRVRFLSAVVGGLIGGSIWQIAEWLFLWFQTSAPYYNAIYGALYQLLFVIIWMFWCWLIVLFGNEVAYVYQNLPLLRREYSSPSPSPVPDDEYLGLAALCTIAGRFAAGQPPLTLKELTVVFNDQDQLTLTLIQTLKDCGFIAQIVLPDSQDSPQFLPSRPLDQIKVKEVLTCLRQSRATVLFNQFSENRQLAKALIKLMENSPATDLQSLNLQDLLLKLNGYSVN